MARIEWVHYRLLNWSRWLLTQGMGPLGFARTEPSDAAGGDLQPWIEAPVPTNAIEASETHDAVQLLPGELKATLIQFYTGKGTEADHIKKLCCSRSTLHARIERAHRLLGEHFEVRRSKADHAAREERARVEKVQQAARPPAVDLPPLPKAGRRVRSGSFPT